VTSIKLVLFLGFDPSELAQVNLPENYEVVSSSFLELENIKGILQNVNWILINLTNLSQSGHLNDESIKRWREVFSDLVQKSVASDGHYAQLVGVARSPDWQLAELGVCVGTRDLVLLTNVTARLTQTKSASVDFTKLPEGGNILPFRDPRALTPTESKDSIKIPMNLIPVPIRGLEGQSKAIENLRNLIRKCAPTQSTLLISGETGVGKEHIARSIHEYSQQSHRALKIIHCSELSENNFDQYFSDSSQTRPGTLLIEQIENLSMPLQSRLTAYLVNHGHESSESQKPRILVSTQADLKHLCETGKFREDLYFRINVIEIALPPLRHRRGDLEDLSDSLMARIARRNSQKRIFLSSASFEKILHYDWPGNIRELENVLEHGSLSAWSKNSTEILPEDLPEHIQSAEMSPLQKDSLKEAVRRFERDHIAKTLSRFGGSKEVAAEALGMSLASLYRKLGNS
jgi:transcriptional regulator of acetoin/glycerol metabolism